LDARLGGAACGSLHASDLGRARHRTHRHPAGSAHRVERGSARRSRDHGRSRLPTRSTTCAAPSSKYGPAAST
jgi:hypothetical protein